MDFGGFWWILVHFGRLLVDFCLFLLIFVDFGSFLVVFDHFWVIFDPFFWSILTICRKFEVKNKNNAFNKLMNYDFFSTMSYTKYIMIAK